MLLIMLFPFITGCNDSVVLAPEINPVSFQDTHNPEMLDWYSTKNNTINDSDNNSIF